MGGGRGEAPCMHYQNSCLRAPTIVTSPGPDLLKSGLCSEKMWGPQGRPQEFLQGGGATRDLGDGSLPAGSRGRADGILFKMTYTDIVFCTLTSFTAWKYVGMLQEFFWSSCEGPIFVGAPVQPNMLNMPKSASAARYKMFCYIA